MVDVSELVQSKWLTAQDVKDSNTKTVVIVGVGDVKEETSSKGEKYKALIVPVQIDGKMKDWKLNRSSLKRLLISLGKDTSLWVGQKVLLTTMLMQGGKEGIIPV